jgi:uncharacterized protein YqgQ
MLRFLYDIQEALGRFGMLVLWGLETTC